MPTTADLLDLRGIGQRATSYRFELLDLRENVIGEIHPDRDNTPTITQDSTRFIQRDMQNLNLTPTERAEVNTFSDRVRPNLVLENGAEFPLGVFLFADPSRPRYSYGLPLSSSLLDKGFILDQPLSNATSVRAGTPVREAILQLINPLGLAVDFSVENSGAVTGAAMTWAPGASRAQVLSDLCLVGAYFAPYFDNHGVGRIRVRPTAANAVTDVVYADGRNIYAGTPLESDDLLRAPNRFTVIGNDAAAGALPIVGTYDLPADAPHSFYNRGFRVIAIKQQQGLANNGAAAQAARVFADTQSVFEYVTFDGPPDPRHDGNSIVEYMGERWLEVSWSMVLGPAGPMTHQIRKVY